MWLLLFRFLTRTTPLSAGSRLTRESIPLVRFRLLVIRHPDLELPRTQVHLLLLADGQTAAPVLLVSTILLLVRIYLTSAPSVTVIWLLGRNLRVSKLVVTWPTLLLVLP